MSKKMSECQYVPDCLFFKKYEKNTDNIITQVSQT